MFNIMGILNILFQFQTEPWGLESTVSMSMVLLLALIKCMFFLRIFDELSYLVTLLRSVIYDLRIFMCFYFVLVFMFSLIIGVLGFQNYSKDKQMEEEIIARGTYPGAEYKYLSRFLANIVTVIRMSIGDNDFSATVLMDQSSNRVFWSLWFVIAFTMCIVFLNFIIAEASASYAKVSSRIKQVLLYQKVTLINESEEMMFNILRTPERFPKFYISREPEEDF